MFEGLDRFVLFDLRSIQAAAKLEGTSIPPPMPERPRDDDQETPSKVVCFYSRLPYDPEFEIPFVSWQDLQAELPERLGCARRKQIRDLEEKMAAILGDGHSAESVSRLLHRNCGWLIKEMRERVRKAYAESPYSNF